MKVYLLFVLEHQCNLLCRPIICLSYKIFFYSYSYLTYFNTKMASSNKSHVILFFYHLIKALFTETQYCHNKDPSVEEDPSITALNQHYSTTALCECRQINLVNQSSMTFYMLRNNSNRHLRGKTSLTPELRLWYICTEQHSIGSVEMAL